LSPPPKFTVNVTVVVWVKPFDVPVMVTVVVPVVAVLVAVKVNVLLLFVVLLGLNDAVTPLGRVEVLKLTLPLKLVRVMLMVLVPRLPCVMVTLEGEADRLKSPVVAALTVRETLVEWVVVPLVPLIVRG